MVSRVGEINGWKCDKCRETTYVVHVDDGVTPMFLGCRAEGIDPREALCRALSVSLMYPRSSSPAHVLAAVRWEWYRPTPAATKRMEPGMREHIEKGGLALRPLTAAGRSVLAARANVDETGGERA